MKVLSINAGSSSLKWQLINLEDNSVIAKGLYEKIGLDGVVNFTFKQVKIQENKELENHNDAISDLISKIEEYNVCKLSEISGVGHRVVQGADAFDKPIQLTDEIITKIEEFSELAPLHNPGAIMAIKAFMKILNVPHIAVFDTSFHQTISKEKYLYPIPLEDSQNYKIRKYGFHGISHQYITEQLKNELKQAKVNAIICHIGNGASVSVINESKCVNTTMGFTPLDGLMMGTRSGTIDASIIPYLMNKKNCKVEDIFDILNKKSGILGFLKDSSDLRDLSDRYLENDENAVLAMDIYVSRIADYIAQYYIQIDGKIDGLVFTAGVGENSALLRKLVINKIKSLGFELNEKANDENIKLISNNSKKIFVIPTNEELMIALETNKIIKEKNV